MSDDTTKQCPVCNKSTPPHRATCGDKACVDARRSGSGETKVFNAVEKPWWQVRKPETADYTAHNLTMRPTGRDPVLVPNPGFVPTKSNLLGR